VTHHWENILSVILTTVAQQRAHLGVGAEDRTQLELTLRRAAAFSKPHPKFSYATSTILTIIEFFQKLLPVRDGQQLGLLLLLLLLWKFADDQPHTSQQTSKKKTGYTSIFYGFCIT
jgi:hypothetical protein